LKYDGIKVYIWMSFQIIVCMCFYVELISKSLLAYQHYRYYI